MIEKRDFYINGQWVAPSAANDFEVINPSTEEPCAVISLGAQADTDAAVAAAKAAFNSYATTSKEERLRLLRRLFALYNEAYDGEGFQLGIVNRTESCGRPRASDA